MRAALSLLLGLVFLAGPAFAGGPGDQQGVTILRGSSAPPPPPPAPEQPTIVQREIVYVPSPAYPYPGYAIPTFGVVSHHRPGQVITTPLPNGWPLFVGNSARH